ncbi:hypothetical protein [Frigidibacter sp. ROC022]|uniref:hypothetical protein n=1 Tax=Frigidibacter sp. ROC022 TaxID=2971796 RepID=UPI00215AD50F|nr:hypothetical protein [Frigidibacter sp. ROC022]MCR8723101.1 hypothetical protein [Frigidibacter sp. ROC022]
MKHAMTVYLLGAGAALAHGGHEEAIEQGGAHWLTAGDHLIVLLLAGIVLGIGVRSVLRRKVAASKRA